jgi:hypothetical protein
MKYLDIKERLAMPIIYSKNFIKFGLAYAMRLKPVIRKTVEVDLEQLGKDPVKAIVLTSGPSLVFVLLFVGALVQLLGKFWFIWVWVSLYLAFMFDYVWLDESEEEFIRSNMESLREAKEEEEDKDDE